MKHFSKVAVASALLLSGIAAAPAAQATEDVDLGIDASGSITLEGLCLEVEVSADTSGITVPALPDLPGLPDLPDHGLELPPVVDLPELPDLDAAKLVVVLSDGTEKVLEGSLTAGFFAEVDTPAGVVVASGYIDLGPDYQELKLLIGVCDTDDDGNGDGNENGAGDGDGTAPPAQPVTGTPSFTG